MVDSAVGFNDGLSSLLPPKNLSYLLWMFGSSGTHICSIPGEYLIFLIFRVLTVWSWSWYIEDCERLQLLRPLKKLEKHPLELVVSAQHVLMLFPTLTHRV